MIVLQLNVRSLLSNQIALNQLLKDLDNRESKVDLVLMCETFLTGQTYRFINLLGYTLISNEHVSRRGGGTGILVRKEIVYKKWEDLCPFVDGEIEATFIEITAKNRKPIICR